MAPKNKIILDTDPGVDDVLALLLALSASPEELELAMISVTYGNVSLQSCLRNVVALFHVLEKEMSWRKTAGKKVYAALGAHKPIVAVGAEHPLENEDLMADHFHGADGLHGVHEEHPHLTPADTWRDVFKDCPTGAAGTSELPTFFNYFSPSRTVAHREILRMLREEPADTITIVAIGPLTNLALAASEDPETFLRVKEVVVMGGAVNVAGNITPCAEFNCYADAVAAARVFALTSPTPASTMPPVPMHMTSLPAYPAGLSRQLKLSLFPLDITTPHELRRFYYTQEMKTLKETGSPLAQWTDTFLSRTFDKIDSMLGDGSEAALSLHDPLCIWYMLTRDNPAWRAVPEPEDVRIETSGQWTRGMHIVDRRVRARMDDPTQNDVAKPEDPKAMLNYEEVPSDHDGWLSAWKGNRINRIVASPGEELFAEELIRRVFAY